MFEKLEALEKQYLEFEKQLAEPDIFEDQEKYRKITKAHADLDDIVHLFRKYKAAKQQYEDNKELMHDSDPEIKSMAEEENALLHDEFPAMEQELRVMLLPPDPLDEKNIVLEIRAGTGGEEAALFAGDLFRMYSRYAERMNWKVEIMSENPTDNGGYKELIALITGNRVYRDRKSVV